MCTICMITKGYFLFLKPPLLTDTTATKAWPDFMIFPLVITQKLKEYFTFRLWTPKLTNQNQSRGLKKPLVVPVWVNLLQQVTHPVVFPKPDSGVHHQARYQTEGLVTHDEALGLGNVGRVVHVGPHVLHCWRVHLSVDDLHRWTGC